MNRALLLFVAMYFAASAEDYLDSPWTLGRTITGLVYAVGALLLAARAIDVMERRRQERQP